VQVESTPQLIVDDCFIMTLEKFFQMDAIREEQEEAARKELHHEKRTEARKSRIERRKNQAKDSPKVATPKPTLPSPTKKVWRKKKDIAVSTTPTPVASGHAPN